MPRTLRSIALLAVTSDDLFITAVIAATIDSNLVLKADRIDYRIDCQ